MNWFDILAQTGKWAFGESKHGRGKAKRKADPAKKKRRKMAKMSRRRNR